MVFVRLLGKHCQTWKQPKHKREKTSEAATIGIKMGGKAKTCQNFCWNIYKSLDNFIAWSWRDRGKEILDWWAKYPWPHFIQGDDKNIFILYNIVILNLISVPYQFHGREDRGSSSRLTCCSRFLRRPNVFVHLHPSIWSQFHIFIWLTPWDQVHFFFSRTEPTQPFHCYIVDFLWMKFSPIEISSGVRAECTFTRIEFTFWFHSAQGSGKKESRNSVVFEQYERCLEFTDTGVGQHVHLNVETGFKLSGIVSSAIIVGEQVLCDTHPPTPQRRLRLSSELSGNWANIVTIVTIVHQLD